ncbi:MAG: bifunctional diaminohydroxyphosphoribosylaminopyrimidine deaminase/5-amino-6-(5-phosphoribosylamino)uracil reductase RibD [Deltaproteobacteria bacterium]|nr:bifunctional diaminohydroxyphosphoribosylaminopyrimidine deaminase/5-amino-6-(5-phosphoribosylamino)uracil reductase RibD [Deltaproteobacteria bacterium]
MRKKRSRAPERAEDQARHERFMRRALALARRGEGWTSPNPMVGAVVARGDRIVAEGWHRRLGAEHAEAMALRRAGRRARGATLYVTLEPCNHTARTPPCTDQVITSGVARVVTGMRDPNRRVRGGGDAALRRAGLVVVEGLLERECRALNAAFVKQALTGLPFVTLKMAMSLDGKVATARGRRTAISGPEGARFVHGLRHASDAILVGVRTVRVDDPLLTTRIRGAGGRAQAGKDPLRVIVDSRLRMPPGARLLHTGSPAGTIIAAARGAARSREARLAAEGAAIWRLPSRQGGVSLRALMRALGERGVQSVLIEGGPAVAVSALEERVVDRLLLLIAPRLMGVGAPGLFDRALRRPLSIKRLCTGRLGGDLLLDAELTPA